MDGTVTNKVLVYERRDLTLIQLIKNRYLPLKNIHVDCKTRKYLIEKIGFSRSITDKTIFDRMLLVEKIERKGYSEKEATELLGINKLISESNILSRVQEKLIMGKTLTNTDIDIINEFHSKIKLNLNIFKIMVNIIFDPIDRIPKKMN
jgi:hypothetical protein